MTMKTMLRWIGGIVMIVGLGMGVVGCAGGQMTMDSQVGQNVLSGQFDTAFCDYQDKDTVRIVLVAGPIEKPRQVMHIRMFYRPKAGKTPLDPQATNCVVRYVVFDGDQAGLYGGGGLVMPRWSPGSGTFSARLRNASLRLLDATEQFDPPTTLAFAEGRFTATRDDKRTGELLNRATQLLSQHLGYPRFADAEAPAP